MGARNLSLCGPKVGTEVDGNLTGIEFEIKDDKDVTKYVSYAAFKEFDSLEDVLGNG